jgi:dihydrofolate reductase
MGKVLWHVTMSLDGFIASTGGDMSWMAEYAGPNATVDEVLAQIGAVFIGNRTFRGAGVKGAGVNKGAGSPEGRAYGGAWTGPQFVLTHHSPSDPPAGFVFVNDLREGLDTAKFAAGDKYVSVLGASTAQQCLDAGLVDEILVHIVPVLLGDGVRLFVRPGGDNVRLERIALTATPQVTNLWLRVAT